MSTLGGYNNRPRGYWAFSQVAHDLAAIAIPIAFLASDRIRCGLPRGEQTILLALFGAVLTVLVIFADRPVGTAFGSVPLGPVVMMMLLSVALRRASAVANNHRHSRPASWVTLRRTVVQRRRGDPEKFYENF